MEPINNDFVLGQLTANCKNLDSSVKTLAFEVEALRHDISEIKLFRAKVVGMSVAASVGVSMLSFFLTRIAEAAWGK